MHKNKTPTFTLRALSDKIGPVARNQTLTVALNDKIYYFGGDIPRNELTTDVSCGTIRVFDTTSDTWIQIDTTPPRAKCNNTKLYGAAVSTDIWVLEGNYWHVFDTIQRMWRDSSIQLDQPPAEHHALGVVKNTIVYYDNAHGFEDMHVVALDTETNLLKSHPQGYGNLPYDRSNSLMIALNEDILFLYAPYASYEEERARKRGEMFFYDLKQDKWARADTSKKLKRIEVYTQYIGRVEYLLLFRYWSNRTIWTLDLRTLAWKEYPINEDDTTRNIGIIVTTLLDDKIYCCMKDGKVCVIDITGVKSARSQQIMNGIVQRAKDLLASIKPPGQVIDEFSAEPILIDTALEAVKLDDIQSYREIASNFKELFPLIDPAKIISRTVPEPSETVRLHKNFLHYLTLAWSNHFSVVVSPDIIFFTILCEIADEIVGDPDSYRHLFTDSNDHKPIMSLTHNVDHIDLAQLIDGISKNTPVDSSIFTANFSSSTAESQLAIQSAFCEAMSVYYLYVGGRCGIPRVKVVGTKEDWQKIEQKVHRMWTEVFNQDATTTQKLSTYLTKVEAQVRKMYTTRDPLFWKDMFYIDDCQSGHMAVVTGWIALFYIEHEAVRKDGHTMYSGNDFYNYKSHISTVKWQNLETQRHFELNSGLVSSRIVTGANELDAKYPWLEPSFSHVIIETNGSGKMSPEEYKAYIDTLADDRWLMQKFYELLKDKPMQLVKGGDKELSFRYQLAGVQIDAWKEEFMKTGQSLLSLDLTKGNCGDALSSYRPFKEVNRPAAESLANKICEYLTLDRHVKSVNICNQREAVVPLEESIVKTLIGYASLEELSLSCVSTEAYDHLAQLVLHPQCKLRTLKIGGDDGKVYHAPTPNYGKFAEALSKTTAPLETLFMMTFSDVQLAQSISHLCTKSNGLKKFKLGSSYIGSIAAEPMVILLRGIVASKSLEEISFFNLGQREVIQGNQKISVNALDDELMEFIVNNLPQNPSLKVVTNVDWVFSENQVPLVLRIPSLREIGGLRTKYLSFLAVTRQLEKIKLFLRDCTVEQAEYLREFLADEKCTLKELDLSHSNFAAFPEAIIVIANGLAKNKSLQVVKLEQILVNDMKIAEELRKLERKRL